MNRPKEYSARKRKYDTEYRASHKEEMREYQKNYYLVNKEKCKRYSKLWAYKNPKRAKERVSKWKLEHSEKNRMTNKKWTDNNKDRTRAGHLKRKFGITVSEYQEMFDVQNGKCAICGKDDNGKSLSVDHNHNTGKVRGLLCRKCNTGIGLFNDNISLIYKAVRYLEDHEEQ